MKSKKWLFILIGVVLLLIVIAIVKGGGKGREIEVSVEKAEKRTIVETVAASGKIQPETEVIISSDVSGEIIQMAVSEGQQVKRGDLLVKIDPDLVETALSRAEAALNTSKANLSREKARLTAAESQFMNAKAIYERNQKLFENKVLSQAEFDQAKANFEVAESEVQASRENVEAAKFNIKSAEATLNEARENLGRTSIFSPLEGVITKMNREEGERVVGTAQMAGTEIMTVADLSVMEVAVEVNENDIVRVDIGDTAEVEVDAYLDEKFKGVVTEIANSANVSGMSADQVTNFDVKIRLIPASYTHLLEDTSKVSPFRPGMSATVDIRTNVNQDVLTVPIQAVTTREDTALQDRKRPEQDEQDSTEADTDLPGREEEKECVFVVEDGKAKIIYVNTGIQNTMYIVITEGLQVGEEVIVSPYNAVSRQLKHNSSVKVVDKKKLYRSNED
jgi:HlyD family secretion protein